MSTRQPSPSAHASNPATEVLRLAAFASEPGGGNPAGVVLDASALSDATMQQIAADVGYAETAFVVGPGSDTDDRALRVRYFSPGAEVPFCGHATVATAVALAERRGGLGPSRSRLRWAPSSFTQLERNRVRPSSRVAVRLTVP